MKYSVWSATLALSLCVGATAPAQPTCRPTPADMEGPFYTANAPLREATGKGLAVSGIVRSAAGCEPIRTARVEWWQANPRGEYDDAHRGSLVTGESGAYQRLVPRLEIILGGVEPVDVGLDRCLDDTGCPSDLRLLAWLGP